MGAALEANTGDLVLDAHGLISFGVGDSSGAGDFIIDIPLLLEDMLGAKCDDVEASFDRVFLAGGGSCVRDTGVSCQGTDCPLSLGPTTCVEMGFLAPNRCDCALEHCLANSLNTDDPSTIEPVCGRNSYSNPQETAGGHWAREVCVPAAMPVSSVCEGQCAMQLAQSGGVSSGERTTTRCVMSGSDECDCTGGLSMFGFLCKVARTCTCVTCTEQWVP